MIATRIVAACYQHMVDKKYMHVRRRIFLTFILILFSSAVFAKKNNIVNVYIWSEEIPSSIITNFEKETGIKVNLSSFDSNEIMYSKIRTSNPGYDIIEPSSYYVERMRRQNMLLALDRNKLSNFQYVDPWFSKQEYDPNNQFNIPFIWGITGIFTNEHYFPKNVINDWSDLLDKRYKNQLMMVDDPREVFTMALLMLGYSINDKDPKHIHQAWLKLQELMPNIRLFNTDAIKSILIDEDATVGMAWNGDLCTAALENKQLNFIIPKQRFEVWVDSFAILKTAPHIENAYRFLNYLLRPEVSAAVSQQIGYSTANLAAKQLLPDKIKNNPGLYPSAEVLKHSEFENDVGDDTFALYEKYWEQLKMRS